MKPSSKELFLGMMEDTALIVEFELRITGTDTRDISGWREILEVLCFGTRIKLELL